MLARLLPPAGAPRQSIVGRWVRFGAGFGTLLPVEPSGRMVVIGVKLARNAGALSAAIAPVLTYVAYSRALHPAALEQ